MKQLFLTVAWLEFTRTSVRSWLLLIIVLGYGFFLSSYDLPMASVDIEISTVQSSELIESLDQEKDLKNNKHHILKQTIKPVVTAAALTLGFIVLMTIPFRGKQEWEDGQFQMIAMGDYSFYQVELVRFLGYLFLSTLFTLAVLFSAGIYLWVHEVATLASIANIQILATYIFIVLVPVLLAFGIFVSAINTAYYREGQGKLLTLIKYVSCLSFFHLTLKAIRSLNEAEGNIIPALRLPISVPGVFDTHVQVSWVAIILSVAVSAGLLYWAGRILEEVEA